MKLFLTTLGSVSFLVVSIWFCRFRGKPIITLEFDSFHKYGRKVVLEAENADGTKMSIKEAERILRKNERHTIILSEDDGINDPEDSFNRYKRNGFFEY
jgi:hypothetical protein